MSKKLLDLDGLRYFYGKILARFIDKNKIIQTAEVNDSTKIPSSAVTFGINEKIIPILLYANHQIGNCIVTAVKLNNLIHLNVSSNTNTPNNSVAGVLPPDIRPKLAEITIYTLAKQTSAIGVIGINLSINGNITLSSQELNEPIKGWNINASYPI